MKIAYQPESKHSFSKVLEKNNKINSGGLSTLLKSFKKA